MWQSLFSNLSSNATNDIYKEDKICSIFKIKGQIRNVYYLEDEFKKSITQRTNLKIENKLENKSIIFTYDIIFCKLIRCVMHNSASYGIASTL